MLAKQLNELEIRRIEVFTLLKQLDDMKKEKDKLENELSTQLKLEKEAHGYTKIDLKLAIERADFYNKAYEDLKKTPKSSSIGRWTKVIVVVGIIATAGIIYAAVRN